MSRDAIERMVAAYPDAPKTLIYGETLDSLSREELMAAVCVMGKLEWEARKSSDEREERRMARMSRSIF